MASMPILVVTLIAAHPIIHLLFGRSYDAAAPALPVLAGAFVLTSLGYLAGNMTVILELQRDFVRYAAVGVVVNAALNLVLIPRYGFLAAAWVTLVTEATVISLALRRVRARLEMTVAWGRLARIVIATAALALVVWLARVAAFPLGALLALAAVAYPLGLIAVGALDLAEVRGVLRVRGGGGPAEDAGSQ
jgi:O-antigen/teichoic acid export membrane protein